MFKGRENQPQAVDGWFNGHMDLVPLGLFQMPAGIHKDQFPDPVRITGREGKRDISAQRMAHERHPFQLLILK